MARKNFGSERRGTQGAGKPSTGFHTFTPVKQSEYEAAIEKLARSIRLGDGQIWSTEKWKDKINDGVVELTLSQFRDYFRTLLHNGAQAGLVHSVILKPDFETGVEKDKNLVFRFADRFAEEGENPKAVMLKRTFLTPKDEQRKFFEIYDLIGTQSVALRMNEDSPPVGYFTHWEKDKPIPQPLGGIGYDDVKSIQLKKQGKPAENPVTWGMLFNNTYLKAKAKTAFSQASNPLRHRVNQPQPLGRLWHDVTKMPEGEATTMTMSRFKTMFEQNKLLFESFMARGKTIKVKDDKSDVILFGLTPPDPGP